MTEQEHPPEECSGFKAVHLYKSWKIFHDSYVIASMRFILLSKTVFGVFGAFVTNDDLIHSCSILQSTMYSFAATDAVFFHGALLQDCIEGSPYLNANKCMTFRSACCSTLHWQLQIMSYK